MEPPSFLRLPSEHGERFSGVFRFGRLIEDDLLEATLVGTKFQVLFNKHICHDVFTVYDAVVLTMEPCFLHMDDQSRLVPYEGPYSTPLIKEVCAGIGGLGLGATVLGFQVVAALDSNPLACQHMELNQIGNGNVLCRDLGNDSAKGELHVAGGVCASTLSAGFPCQPHSTQGLGAGFMDPRHHVFVAVLRTAYLHVVDCLVLECTPQAQFDKGVRFGLMELASIMGWQIHETTLALSHQWPCRRHRWWAILCSSSWQSTTLLKWPTSSDFQTVGDILPSWGCWPSTQEQELLLNPQELAAYQSPEFGLDKRLLEHSDMAPTFLHSYGCALSACPCGFRSHPFADGTLRRRGLRGCFVISLQLHQPRYLHPVELAALLGFPATMSHLTSLRGALCLLGSVASPLQALWVFSCLQSLAKGHTRIETLDCAQSALSAYRQQLLLDLEQLFGSSNSIPRSLALCDVDGLIPMRLTGFVTVEALLQAQAQHLSPGAALELWDGPRRLPDHQLLLQQGVHGPYLLRVGEPSSPCSSSGSVVLAINYQSQIHIAFLQAGDFLFQALLQCGLPLTEPCMDEDNQLYGLDQRIWHCRRLRLSGSSMTLTAHGLPQAQQQGLSDAHIWLMMRAMLSNHLDAVQLVHPLLAQALLQDSSWTFKGMDFLVPLRDHMICIFAVRGHWVLLWDQRVDAGCHWTFFDGLSSTVRPQAQQLAQTLSLLWGESTVNLQFHQTPLQSHAHTCGTIALWQLFCLLHGNAPLSATDEWQLHEHICSLPHAEEHIWAMGRSPTEVPERLRALLVDKGVPEPDSDQRAQDVIKTLGLNAVAEALIASNAWAALKSLASRPSTRLRLIKDYELKAHINQQASSKHGAHVAKPKQKKHSAPTTALPPVDPISLKLVPNTFVDDDGDEIPQIQFSEVGKDAHGLAFCTLRQAQPFMEATDNISSTTLGLLITSEASAEGHRATNLHSLQYPALCAATGEPMLLQGSLLTLSDGAIHRKQDQATDLEVSSTDIIRIQMHREELSMDWSQITGGPIRALLQLAPSFRLCSGRQCGAECPLYHPPIDEDLPGLILDIWARSFCNMNGKTTKAGQAAYFQALLRVPSVALEQLLRLHVQGLYVEPRAPLERGPHPDYSVIWLPGRTLEQALHRLRTCDHGLSLAKMNQRFGIRVRAQHEQQAHQALRPDDEYVAVQIKQIYQIFPLPHGLSRQQINKLLAAWGWTAKPLQTTRGNHQGQGWAVGSDSPPPNPVMRGFDRDLLITLHKEVHSTTASPPVVASQKTRRFLKEGTTTSTTDDPWHNGADPWANLRPVSSLTASSAAPARRFEQLQEHIQETIKQHVHQPPPGLEIAQDPAIQRLQVNITELQAQGAQFQSRFQEAGQRMTSTEQQLTHLQHVVEQQGQQVAHQIATIQQEVDNKTQILQSSLQGSLAAMQRDFDPSLDSKLASRFDRIESMLAKKSRTET